MHFPTFSIITICYNAEKEIEKTVQSVVNQSYKQIEYIIIDGNSTDATLQVLDGYKSHIQKMVSEPDKGLYDAMNKGLRVATGDYLCFLNAGDYFYDSDVLSNIVDVLNGDCPDVIYGDTALVDKQGTFMGMRKLSPPKQLTWKSFRMGMLVCHQAFMPKRKLAPLYDTSYRYSADFDWCIKILKQSKTTFNTQTTLINYLNEGVTTRNHKASLKERYRIMCKYYGYFSTSVLHLWFAFRHFFKK